MQTHCSHGPTPHSILPKVREAPRDSDPQKNARKDGRGRQPRNGWPWKGCDTWGVNRFRQFQSKTKLADPPKQRHMQFTRYHGAKQAILPWTP